MVRGSSHSELVGIASDCLTTRISGDRVARRKGPCATKRQEDVVKSRLPIRAAAVTSLWLAQLGAAAEPARLPLDSTTPQAVVSLDQQLADNVAQRLAGLQLRGYEVEIVSQNGVVELVGTVSAAAQRDE